MFSNHIFLKFSRRVIGLHLRGLNTYKLMPNEELSPEKLLLIEKKRSEAQQRLRKRQAATTNHSSSSRPASTSQSQSSAFSRKCSNSKESIALSLTGENTFTLSKFYDNWVVNICKTIPSRKYDMKTKRWSFALSDYSNLVQKLSDAKLSVERIPNWLLVYFMKGLEKTDISLDYLGEQVQSKLMSFQSEAIRFAIKNGGRILLADDMGLGKTLQALCIAMYYQSEWPLLIVCPSSLKSNWKETIHQWFPSISENDVNVICTIKDCDKSSNIVIVSYDQLAKLITSASKTRYKVVIADESHYFKNLKTQRTKCFIQAACTAKRVILASGTPALSKPIELFPQLKVLQPSVFYNLHNFGLRYCNAKKTHFGWSYDGTRNIHEMKFILQSRLMIRRTKNEVLGELPPKSRKIMFLERSMLNLSILKEANLQLKTIDNKSNLHSEILKYFSLTALAKAVAVCSYLQEILELKRKFIVFAHHQSMISKLCEYFDEKSVNYIKLDGSVSSKQRTNSLQRFNDDDNVLAAILSIKASSVGFNITSASIVVFAELFWNPGLLAQAEDRVYRIGQKNEVDVIYLIGKKTSDDLLWPIIKKKLQILEGVGLATSNLTNASTSYAADLKNLNIEDIIDDLDND